MVGGGGLACHTPHHPKLNLAFWTLKYVLVKLWGSGGGECHCAIPPGPPLAKQWKRIFLLDLGISSNFLQLWFKCIFWVPPPPPPSAKQWKKILNGDYEMETFSMAVLGREYVTTYCWRRGCLLAFLSFSYLHNITRSLLPHVNYVLFITCVSTPFKFKTNKKIPFHFYLYSLSTEG